MAHLQILLFVIFSITTPVFAQDWTVYDPCTFEEDEYFDGDSFQLKAPTRYTYIFRLYGVDAPETDKRYPDRIREQAEYFGIPENRVVHWGEQATKFTRKFLKDGKIVAYTKKEKSGSQSSKNRYYAVIEVDGERLDEALVTAGLARAYGVAAAYPRRISDKVYQSRLRRAESDAKKEKLGIWSESGSP
jgi:endonuclease YncB( thermonuclease family)